MAVQRISCRNNINKQFDKFLLDGVKNFLILIILVLLCLKNSNKVPQAEVFGTDLVIMIMILEC